jgi:hypothetical protein
MSTLDPIVDGAQTHVVRVQIIADVRIDSRPRAKRLQLTLGLRHVTVEEREIANILGPHLGIRVDRVESLMASRFRRENSISSAQTALYAKVVQGTDSRLTVRPNRQAHAQRPTWTTLDDAPTIA